MRLQKLEKGEEVTSIEFYDFIDCGDHYLLTFWRNETKATVILNQNTILEDLHDGHGGSIYYSKLCMKTFRVCWSDNRGSNCSHNLDDIINWTKIYYADDDSDTQLLKVLVKGEGLGRLTFFECLVRWASEGSSRGTDWYRLLDD